MSIEILKSITDNPVPFAKALGYNKLTEDIHNPWIKRMFHLKQNGTLQAHRGSYKTTCLIIALTLWIIAKPAGNIIFLRKSQEDVKDVLSSVSKNIQNPIVMNLMKDIYREYPKFIIDNATELELSNYRGKMGRQILGLGLKSSITGKHGSVITDDIVTLKDRISQAEREQTKNQYMELINIASEENHRIFNTGTPWHKNDAFTLMPKPEVFTVYQTGILSPERIQERKDLMTSSLFAANYELKHVADGDILFHEPEYGKFPIGGKAYAQIDAAYGGTDASTLTIITEVDNKLYTVGWWMPGHIDQHYNEIISRLERFQAIECSLENNADKGFLKKELEKRCNIKFHGYHERMNKYYKISTYGKSVWNRVILDMEESDMEYISEIMDYNENAKHDDAPDSFASLIRWKYNKKRFSVGSKEAEALFAR